MDPEDAPARTNPTALRWVVALLLLLAGGAGLVPVVEADEAARIERVVVVERHQHVARRRAGMRPVPARRLRAPRVIAALAARTQALLVPTARRGPPRTPCVVALT